MNPSSIGQSYLARAMSRPLEALRTGATRLSTGVRKRFAEGAAAAKERYERESRRFALEEKHERPALPNPEGALCGLMVSLVASEVLPLFEGGNRFRIGDHGRVTRSDGDAEEGWFLRVIEDRAEIEEAGLKTERRTIESNEGLSLAGEPFVLKLLNEGWRENERKGGRS